MASKAAEHGGGANFYTQAKNNPAVLKKRQQVAAELDSAVQRILANKPGRVPHWERQRLMQMDRFCLAHGKRCIMWDDEGAGFYLMLNWDWLRNRPAQPASPEEALQPGWWQNVKQLLRPPLMDASLSDAQLAAWVDAHTMRVHQGFLDKLKALRRDPATQQLVLEDPYWQQLQQLPPEPSSSSSSSSSSSRSSSAAGSTAADGRTAAVAAQPAAAAAAAAQQAGT